LADAESALSPPAPNGTGGTAALRGKRIIVTRAPEQSRELIESLHAKGAEVFLLPLVRFAPPYDSGPLDEQLARLASFDAILFLSANAVRFVCSRCRELNIDIAGAQAPGLIAAVGPATSRILSDEGVRVDYVAREHTGESLARELRESLAGRSVLLPRSDRGDERVPAALAEIGARVTEVVAYRTAVPHDFDAIVVAKILRAEVDVIIFASPSAVQNFAGVFGANEVAEVAKRVHFAAIGPRTAQTLGEAGLPVAIEAAEASAPGLIAAIERFFTGKTA
jgi:uroporphyrinogen III methyltransferase / synthase